MRWSVRVCKRVVDLVFAGMGLALTLPLFPAIMAAIYLESPGPVFFRQRRAGRLLEGRGRPRFEEFEMLKFRTMRVGADRERGPVLAAEDDPRITRVGRVLRRTRLDELPQLWNVLRGQMSLVGPRPEQPRLAENLAAAIPYFEERMRGAKPGITGFAQISLGYSGKPLPGTPIERHAAALSNPFKLPGTDGALADDMRCKLLYDLAYSAAQERLSTFLRMELSILLRTPLVMLRGLGR